ncbi:MAG: hypothetical protein A2157_11880 [Deltaproteobacteria bacterium RBG_16_47_11]|nr:MAG: hypothetical protein A2157_11880 [Deltaproteobacteria bacterium RBG_16_47_11]
MKNRILVDTTIWIEFFRAKPKISDFLKTLLMENAVWTCGVVLFEVLQGIKAEAEKTKILDILSLLPYAEMTKSLWQKSADLSIALKKNGITLPHSDLFVATVTREHNLYLFTIDKHFEKIPDLKLYEVPS